MEKKLLLKEMPACPRVDSFVVTLCSYKFNELELREKDRKERRPQICFLNVRNYGYANMKATGALFSPGFDSAADS